MSQPPSLAQGPPPAAARARERAELEALFVRLERPLYNVVYRWLWNVEESRDVVQDAFVKLSLSWAKVPADQRDPWLFRVALNLAAKRRRSALLWRWVSLEPLFESEPAKAALPDQALGEAAEHAALKAAIDALPEKLRAVVVLCELSEMSYERVSEALGNPAGTVGSRRNAALAKLRETLQPSTLPPSEGGPRAEAK